MDNLLEPMSEAGVAAADLVARAMNADEGRWVDRTMRFYEQNGFSRIRRIHSYLDDGSAMIVYAKGIGPGRWEQ